MIYFQSLFILSIKSIGFFLGAAKVKLENKGDLSFFNRQDESVRISFQFDFSLNFDLKKNPICKNLQ